MSKPWHEKPLWWRVYEDADGLQVDPETLPPDTGVIVDIATGRPC